MIKTPEHGSFSSCARVFSVIGIEAPVYERTVNIVFSAWFQQTVVLLYTRGNGDKNADSDY